MPTNIKATESSGNVFADLGFQDAREKLVKAELALTINKIIEKRKLKQIEAAEVLGINQPKISALSRGRLKEFSIERLIEFLNKLDQDVKIVVHQKPKSRKAPAKFDVIYA